MKVCRLGLLGRPTTVEGRVVLGQALLALKRFDEVLAEMRVALELDHTSIAAQVLKGEAMLRKGDSLGAIEVFQRVRTLAPTDTRVAQLLEEAERALGRPRMSAVHPAVGFISPGPPAGNPQFATRAYVPHAHDEEDTNPAEEGDEDTGGSFTRPTSLAAPPAIKRSAPVAAQQQPLFGHASPPAQVSFGDATPPPAVLSVGDRSGTVEVDPELDGVEIGDDDFGDIASPPVGGKRAKAAAGSRGAVLPGSRSPKPQQKKKGPQKEVSTVELDDDEMVEVDDTHDPMPMKRPSQSAVRAAVKMPSGPLDAGPRTSPAANRPTAHQPVVAPPPHLAQMIANQPHVMQMQQARPNNSALPTAVAAVPPLPPQFAPAANPFAQTMMPMGQPMQQPLPSPAAAMPTMALHPQWPAPNQQLSAAQMQSADAVDAMFGNGDPAWSQRAAANEATAQPQPPPIDPAFAAMLDQIPAVGPNDSVQSQSNAKAMKTGVRRGRSKLQIMLWVFVGALVIGGGVGVGFKIRQMRLDKQIEQAREQAVALAKLDTWVGWVGARDRLAGIAQASDTPDNRAALARTRALVAYEFGDGFAEAKAALDMLPEGGLDATLARAYVALAQGDAKAARAAADAAAQTNAEDAAVLYVTGQAQLLAGDTKAAISTLKKAVDKEVRPLHALGLARAYGVATQWDEAIASTDRAIALSPDHPGGIIERAMLNAAAGRIVTTNTLGQELRGQLEKVVAEGAKPPADQTRGVSPAQVAYADLALARVDYARGDINAAQQDVKNALAINHDELRFAEEVVDTVYATGSLAQARTAAETVLTQWPDSRRARTTLAEVFLAQGKNIEALDVLAKMTEAQLDPRAFAVRAKARLANGDPEAAKKDYDEALKRSPMLEAALVGRAWLDLESNDVDAARKRIEPRYKDTSPPAIAAVYAAILRASQETGSRDKAKAILENAVKGGSPSLENARAYLELARLYRDMGGVENFRAARAAYEQAARLPEARLESALLLIDDGAPQGGRDTLELLLKDAGDRANAPLLIEVVRARMLVGDHAGANALFPQIEKAQGLVKWQLDRERGRYALRKADYTGAAAYLLKAIEDCGDDAETFLLAADAASDGKQTKLLDRVKALAPKKLKGRPEGLIVDGKIALVEGDNDAAAVAYEQAGKAFEADKASARRVAQATFGRAVAAYYMKNDPAARNGFEYVIAQDPAIFPAYLYLGDMVKERDPKRALELARKAVQYNPDLVEGWVMLGTVASRLKDKKLRAEAITKVGELAPNSEALRTLQSQP
ncbi:MAG: tetratricopeptide repeat protein [Myxococcota bacterium]|nr:tetratricopeptide repeat protein [Myxococcota bacterium]